MILIRLVWIASAAAILAMAAMFSHAQILIPAPGDMMHYEAGDKSFTLNCPTNWHRTGAGGAGGSMVEIDWDPGPDIHFSISSDLAGSLMGDIARSSNAGLDSLGSSASGSGEEVHVATKSPLQQLHEAQGESFGKGRADYQDGATTKLQLNSQEAFVTDFTFKQPLLFSSHELAGKRVSMLSNERRYQVFYYYPRERQAELEPVFKQMLLSVKTGTPGG